MCFSERSRGPRSFDWYDTHLEQRCILCKFVVNLLQVNRFEVDCLMYSYQYEI